MEVSSTNTSIKFNYTVERLDTFDNLTFSLKDGNNINNVDNISPVTINKMDTKDVEFSGLTAGTMYTVSAVTNSKDETSYPQTLEVLTSKFTLIIVHSKTVTANL